MYVDVDRNLCESNGVCEAIAPDLFEIDAHDSLLIKVGLLTAEQLPDAESAVHRCPKQALRLVS